jgi:hypothetical protein
MLLPQAREQRLGEQGIADPVRRDDENFHRAQWPLGFWPL